MKIRRIICAGLLVALCAFGWVHQIVNVMGKENQWNTCVQEARDYASRGLYQRAIQSYEQALTMNEDSELRQEYLSACSLAYEEGVLSRSAYKKALENSCQAEPEQEFAWVRLIELLLDGNSYQEAFKTLSRASRAGASGESLSVLKREITYSFTTGSKYFSDYFATPNGAITVCNADRWGLIASDGETEYDCEYLYISPCSEDGTAVFSTDEKSCLLDGDGVIQAIIDIDMDEARAWGDGLLPVCKGEHWRYFDCESGQYRKGQYKNASSYQDGIAAVCTDGIWTFIDVSGGKISEQIFSDMLLYGNGAYSYDGVLSAKTEDTWTLYHLEDGVAEPVSEAFQARDLDRYYGDAVAFQDESGLWGFVDTEGTVVIEPQFQQAKSFSCGLAAVYDGQKWGFINRYGELAIDYQFLDVGYFTEEGVCPVSTVGGEFHMILLRFPEGV